LVNCPNTGYSFVSPRDPLSTNYLTEVVSLGIDIVPRTFPFDGRASGQHVGIGVPTANDLHSYGEPVFSKSRRDRRHWVSREAEWLGEQPAAKRLDLGSVHLDRFLAVLIGASEVIYR
jgi:hypothetical protein